MHIFTRISLAAAVLLSAACSKDDTTAPNDNIRGTFTASVEGAGFSGTQAVTAVRTGNTLSLVGTQKADPIQRQIDIHILDITGPGTFSLAPSTVNTATYTETSGAGVKTWVTSLPGGGGSVVITQLSATHVTGTFTFAAPAVTATGATTTKNANNGSFSIDIN